MTSVSVIIPAYNASSTITRALQSVLNQTVRPHEILIVDDGSPDGETLIEKLTPFAGEFKLLRKPNGGASSARNHGVAHATGEWIAFLDADDYWENDKIAAQVRIATTHEVDFIASRWWNEVPGQPRVGYGGDELCGRVLRLNGRDSWSAAMTVWTGTVMIRRRILGTDPFVSGLEPAEDRDLWVRLMSTHPSYILADRLSTYVHYDNSLSNADPDRDCGSMIKVINRHAGLLGASGIRNETSIVYRKWAASQLSRGKYSQAIYHSLRRLGYNPFRVEPWYVIVKSCVCMASSGVFSKPSRGAPDSGPAAPR